MDYGNDAGTYLPAEDDLTAYFLDVGQADATLLVSQGEAMLIDAGNKDDSQFIIGYWTSWASTGSNTWCSLIPMKII